MIKPFWMVWVNGKNGPSIQHDNIMEAIREAGRLAEKTNLPAYVLEVVGVAIPRVEVEYKEIKCD